MSRNRIPLVNARLPAWWISAAVLALALAVQATLAHALRIRDTEPSFVLIAVVWYAIRADLRLAAIYGVAAGLLEDILATGTGGAWTISTALCAAGVSVASRGFFADSIPIVAALTVAATLVRQTLFWMVMGLEGYPSGLGGLHFHQAVVKSILDALVMIVAMLIARRFDDRLA